MASTDIADGTRFLKVKFTDTVKSLPYSTKFETVGESEHFRVIHDRQVKVCRMCIQPGHIVRDCPSLKCFKCGKQGHYARECEFVDECDTCSQKTPLCMCVASAALGGEGSETQHSDIHTGDEEEENKAMEREGSEDSQCLAVTQEESGASYRSRGEVVPELPQAGSGHQIIYETNLREQAPAELDGGSNRAGGAEKDGAD